ncbi:transcription antitermination factor NusB [Roseiconus nitratireducens]|uniref:Transcription antitermination protein NusB n=1 Tax=Roseiconus nitratireducens TaxID=2605748 RepID=A0A5M6D6D2_9BACT|nr:transcription antitermination factor NusB [Roseiconus nitratireducens]KAA5543088.1 transcription antitermination factor NusB [Roseiconus nitratireducens]
MSTRRRAREIVLQLLYEADINGTRSEVSAKRFIKSRLQGRKALTSFSEGLFFGTLRHRDEVDPHLARLAKGWSLSRMAVTDRNVMRMAAYEILFSDTPGRVAVNEAVVLIKRYGDKNSPRFVNGILDRLLKEHESGSLPSAAEALDDVADAGR